jgi:hypothetical protein
VMGGMHEMSGSERVARLDEGLVVLDRLLRNDLEPFQVGSRRIRMLGPRRVVCSSRALR